MSPSFSYKHNTHNTQQQRGSPTKNETKTTLWTHFVVLNRAQDLSAFRKCVIDDTTEF
jgi:hypothetical protein